MYSQGHENYVNIGYLHQQCADGYLTHKQLGCDLQSQQHLLLAAVVSPARGHQTVGEIPLPKWDG